MSEELSRTPNRIHIHESVMPIYRALTHGQISDETGKPNDSYEQSPFSTYRDLFLLAACYGYHYHKGKRKPLPSGKKNSIRTEIFGEEGFSIFNAIAISETQDVEILNHPDDVIKIVEEYASLGIAELGTYLIALQGHSMWNLVALADKTKELRDKYVNSGTIR